MMRFVTILALAAFVGLTGCQQVTGGLPAYCERGRTVACTPATDRAPDYAAIEGLYEMSYLNVFRFYDNQRKSYPNAGNDKKTILCFGSNGQIKVFYDEKLAGVNCYGFETVQDSLSRIVYSNVENPRIEKYMPSGVWHTNGDTLFIVHVDTAYQVEYTYTMLRRAAMEIKK